MYCNLVQVDTTSAGSAVEAPGSRGEVPTLKEVEAETAVVRALMQAQKITVLGDTTRAVVYWDTGSNVNLVRQEFARLAGWVGSVVQRLQTSGRVAED